MVKIYQKKWTIGLKWETNFDLKCPMFYVHTDLLMQTQSLCNTVTLLCPLLI